MLAENACEGSLSIFSKTCLRVLTSDCMSSGATRSSLPRASTKSRGLLELLVKGLTLYVFNFYAKLSAIHAQEPLSGHTLLLDGDGSDQAAQAVIEHSRNTFATKYVEPGKPPTPKPEPARTKPKRQARKRKATKVLGD